MRIDSCISITEKQYNYLLPVRNLCAFPIAEVNGRYYFYFCWALRHTALKDLEARLKYLD